MIRNPVIEDAREVDRPGESNRCARCVSGFWSRERATGLTCYCKLMGLDSWSSPRGKIHGVRSCTGRDDTCMFDSEYSINGSDAKKTACYGCEKAVWWTDDERALFCFCPETYRLVFGKNADGDKIMPKYTCNCIMPIEESLDEQEEEDDEPTAPVQTKEERRMINNGNSDEQ